MTDQSQTVQDPSVRLGKFFWFVSLPGTVGGTIVISLLVFSQYYALWQADLQAKADRPVAAIETAAN